MSNWVFFVPRIDLTQETLLTIWAVGGVELIEAPSSGTEYKQCLLLLPTLWLHLLFCCVDITYVRTCVMYPAPLQSDAHTFLGFWVSLTQADNELNQIVSVMVQCESPKGTCIVNANCQFSH